MTKRRRRSKKWIWWVLFLLLLILAGVVCYFVWDNYFNDKKSEGDIGVVEAIEEKREEMMLEAEKNEVLDDDGNEVKDDEKKVVQYEGDDPNRADGLSGAVTYAGINSEKLMIRVNIDQYLQNGNCRLILMRDEASVYEDDVNIVESASTATCEGFDVPISGFSSANYVIEILLSSGEKSGIIRGEVEI